MKRESIFKKINWFYVLFAFLFLIILVNRSFPYFLYGPFGFGYDTGIYKKVFEEMLEFNDVLNSPIDLLPSILAYLFNLFGLPMEWLLYYAYILFSAFIAVPLYLLTREYFGKMPAIIAVFLFSISFVQVFASEFFLYKTMIGAIFMFFAFYYYSKKSYLFYLFLFLVSVSQLPHLLLLIFGIGVMFFIDLFGERKYLKYHLFGFLAVLMGVALLFIFRSGYVFGVTDLALSSLGGENRVDSHDTGLFMTPELYLRNGFLVLLPGIAGVIEAFFERKSRPLLISLLFVSVIVFFKIFFENRFVVELELFLIPFAGYFIYLLVKRFLRFGYMKTVSSIILVLIAGYMSFEYYMTTFPAISIYEAWAFDIINKQEDSGYVLVTDTIYAPWSYGFLNKETLAPGIFESVWNFDQWWAYKQGDPEKKVEMLLEIAEKYGKYYLFVGAREPDPELLNVNEKIRRLFFVNDASVFEVSP